MSKALTDETQLVLYSTLTVPVELLDNAMDKSPEAYDSFTIAFYDFQLHVLDDGEELDAERTVTSSTKNNLFYVHTINNSLVDAEQDILLDFSVNESLSTSLTNAESYTFGSSMGVSHLMGSQSIATTKFTDTYDCPMGISALLWQSTTATSTTTSPSPIPVVLTKTATPGAMA